MNEMRHTIVAGQTIKSVLGSAPPPLARGEIKAIYKAVANYKHRDGIVSWRRRSRTSR